MPSLFTICIHYFYHLINNVIVWFIFCECFATFLVSLEIT